MAGRRRSMSEQRLHLRAGLRRVELRVRRDLLRFPRRVRCPICGWTGPALAPSSKPRKPNRICPRCGSSERYRAVELLLRRRGPVPPGTRLLEISPIGTIEPTATSLGYTYSSTNIDVRDAKVTAHAGLHALPFPDHTFDLAVCLHVLEHIIDDSSALRELGRVLKPTGEALVIVPWDPARTVTFEDQSIDPGQNAALYGQHDHVRIYGADVTTRWRDAGLVVEEQPWQEVFTPDVHKYAALAGNDDRFWMVTRRPTI